MPDETAGYLALGKQNGPQQLQDEKSASEVGTTMGYGIQL